MDNYISLRNDIVQHVMELFNNSLMELPYHNFHHTHSVVEHATFLTAYYNLDEEDSFIIFAAAWFHDTGHLTGTFIGHEAVSVMIMKDFLRGKSADDRVISRIEKCIEATSIYITPGDLPEMILCDADTWHLGTPEFRETDPLVRTETELRLEKHISDWNRKTIRFLEDHQYYTDYCKTTLEAGKALNILWLQSISM
jgi:predicted metal-dependent HD superfamily phosphohydrolase